MVYGSVYEIVAEFCERSHMLHVRPDQLRDRALELPVSWPVAVEILSRQQHPTEGRRQLAPALRVLELAV